MTPLQIRSLASPPGGGRNAECSQALRLPKTLVAIYRIVREDFAAARLDEYLWAFWGFHQETWDQHWRMRPWDKAQLRDIEPRDVVGIEVWEMAAMLSIAMEDEEPIQEYTLQSGEGFRVKGPQGSAPPFATHIWRLKVALMPKQGEREPKRAVVEQPAREDFSL